MLLDALGFIFLLVALSPWMAQAERDGKSLQQYTMRVNQIRSWMRRHKNEFRDPFTNEINYTQMSEQCVDQLDLYEDDNDDIPEDVFEIAIEFK